jgi:hypothetical protein
VEEVADWVDRSLDTYIVSALTADTLSSSSAAAAELQSFGVFQEPSLLEEELRLLSRTSSSAFLSASVGTGASHADTLHSDYLTSILPPVDGSAAAVTAAALATAGEGEPGGVL